MNTISLFDFKSAPKHITDWCALVAGGILSVLVSSDTVDIPEMVRIHKMRWSHFHISHLSI